MWACVSVGVRMIFWGEVFLFLFYLSSLYFGGIFNKTVIPLALVGYDIIRPNSPLCTSLARSTISYPKCFCGIIIVKYTKHDIVTSEPAVYNFRCFSSQVESPLGCGHLVQMINVSIAYNLHVNMGQGT